MKMCIICLLTLQEDVSVQNGQVQNIFTTNKHQQKGMKQIFRHKRKEKKIRSFWNLLLLFFFFTCCPVTKLYVQSFVQEYSHVHYSIS